MEAYRYLGSRGERVIGLADLKLDDGVYTEGKSWIRSEIIKIAQL